MKSFVNSTKSFYTVNEDYFSLKNETISLDPLSDVLSAIKTLDFNLVLSFYKEHPEITENFSYYIKNIFQDKAFNLSLTEAHILSESNFLSEFKKRLLDQLLPPVENENTVWHLVEQASLKPKDDFLFFSTLKVEQLDELFILLGISRIIANKKVVNDLLFSLNILSWRVIGAAMDEQVLKMVPQYRKFENPFIALQKELEELNFEYQKEEKFHLISSNVNYKQIKIYVKQCQEFVKIAFKNASKYGISGKINQSLLKISQQLNRFAAILELLVINNESDLITNSKKLFLNILEYKSHKNNLRELVSENTVLLSHLITTHTAQTGRNYISSTGKEYIQMLLKASGGGLIVGVLVVLKLFYSNTSGSEFHHAFLYSFNYAMGFVMIYLFKFTLATKQPAMTAATMAQVLSDDRNTKKNYLDFAHLVSKLFRTQFIAFIGNIILAFPMALLIMYGLEALFNENFAISKSPKLLNDLNPMHSKVILHACIAGFYLFISGIIVGHVSNNSVFYQIPKRILKNNFINKSFGEQTATKLSTFYEKNWPGILSNIWLGILLGITGPVGVFLGLDLDIRHITFAAGNFALGLYGQGFNVSNQVFFTALSTVFLIGFFNFVVSFGLSMVLAFRSRKVTFGESRLIYMEIFKYFLRNPLRFFLPIRSKLDKNAIEIFTVAKLKE